jgi:TatD DNase family protein
VLVETRRHTQCPIFAPNYKSFNLQKQVFERVLRCCAKVGNEVITVHSIRAAKVVLDHIEAYLPPSLSKVVLHWFTGSKAEAKRAIELGCYFSIDASMLDNVRHTAMVAAIPLDRLLTELDMSNAAKSSVADRATAEFTCSLLFGRQK